MLERVTSIKIPFNAQAPVQLQTPLSLLAADIHGLASSIGVLAGRVAVEEWEYLSILRRNLRAAADQVAERESRAEILRPRSSHPLPLTAYLAAPYSDNCKIMRNKRAHLASECAGFFMASGFSVISPLSMGHHMAQVCSGLKTDFEAWSPTCLRMLESCDILLVLMLHGVKESVGVAAEIAHARELGMPCVQVAYAGGQFETIQNPEWW